MSKEKPKKSKQKKVGHELVKPDDKDGKVIYRMVTNLVRKHHDDLRNAKIAVMWNHAWRTDVDGRLTLGQCKIAKDFLRELSPYDIVILLHHDFWKDPEVTDEQRTALIDHELCHAVLKLDKDQEPVEDERGRKVYRLRHHDIQEFTQVVRRHGLYVKSLELFYKALLSNKQHVLKFDDDEDDGTELPPSGPTPLHPM